MKSTYTKATNLFNQFLLWRYSTVTVEGFDFHVNISPATYQFEITTTIYQGQGEIPQSIRERAATNVVFGYDIPKTKLFIDERNHRVMMRYREAFDQMHYPRFSEIFEELVWIAEQWKNVLDKNDQSDYDFVFVNRN